MPGNTGNDLLCGGNANETLNGATGTTSPTARGATTTQPSGAGSFSGGVDVATDFNAGHGDTEDGDTQDGTIR